MKNMEIKTYGRKINLETLANASASTKGLGSRTGEVHGDFLRQIHR